MGENKEGRNWSIIVRDEYISKKHWHNELEFVYVISGSLIINIDDIMHEIKEGETFIISRGIVHYYIEPEGKSKVCIVKLPLDFTAGFSKETKEYFIKFYRDTLLIQKDKAMHNIFQVLQGITGRKDSIIQESVLVSNIIEITVYLSEHPDLIKNRVVSKSNNDSEIMERMLNYLNEHMNEKITLTEIATHLGFSESYCSKYIKKKTNMNFLEYLNNARILRAEEILRTTDTSITEIAYMTGFTSIQSFNRVFKSLCDVSPSEYRKRLHDKNYDILDKK